MTRHDMPEEEILILLQEGSGVGSGVSSVLALDVIAATRMKFCVECLEQWKSITNTLVEL